MKKPNDTEKQKYLRSDYLMKVLEIGKQNGLDDFEKSILFLINYYEMRESLDKMKNG